VMALSGAMLLSLTFVPAAVAVFLGGRVDERENRVAAWCKRGYRPLLHTALRLRAPVVVAAAVLLTVLCGLLGTRLGSEFIPHLDEGDVVVQALRIPGTSLTQSVAMQATLERALAEIPEVQRVFAKIGTAEVASDPMPPSIADT